MPQLTLEFVLLMIVFVQSISLAESIRHTSGVEDSKAAGIICGSCYYLYIRRLNFAPKKGLSQAESPE